MAKPLNSAISQIFVHYSKSIEY